MDNLMAFRDVKNDWSQFSQQHKLGLRQRRRDKKLGVTTGATKDLSDEWAVNIIRDRMLIR